VHEGLAVIAASVATRTFGAGWPGLLIAAVLPCLFLRSAWQVRARRMDGAAAPGHHRLSVCMQRETRA
jgi:hypothetical protein